MTEILDGAPPGDGLVGSDLLLPRPLGGAPDVPLGSAHDPPAATVSARTADASVGRALQLFAHDVHGSVLAIRELVDRLGAEPQDAVHLPAGLLARAEAHVGELERLVAAVSDRARAGVAGSPRPVLTDLGASIEHVVGRLRFGRRALHLDLDRGVGLLGSRDLGRLIEQLLTNAINHTNQDATIWVRLQRSSEWTQVIVADDGRGVPADLRERVFWPGERGISPPSVTGLGLGLHLARQVAIEAGGTLACEEREGGGALFRLRVPHMAPPASPSRPATAQRPRRSTADLPVPPTPTAAVGHLGEVPHRADNVRRRPR